MTRKLGSPLLGLISGLLICGASSSAFAEQIGDFRLNDFYLEPTFSYNEAHRGRFEAGNSFVSVDWVRDAAISARFKLGSKSLLGAPLIYESLTTPVNPNEPALVEAFGQIETSYGRIRAGVIPILFSLEGGNVESRLRLPRSLFYQNRVIPLRDYGVAYHIDNEGFFSDWAAHNGEGGADLDNEAWFTARWGYRGGRDFQVGFSGSTGRTTPLSTAPSGQTSSTKTRIANMFLAWSGQKLGVEAEGELGEIRVGEVPKKIRAGHVDFDFLIAEGAALLLRYDAFDPNTDAPNDQTQSASVGIAILGKYDTSSLYLIGSKIWQEGSSQPTHQGLLIWRLTPTANPRRL